jgi:patatin-like phospholipase/acyl hydrolase
MNDQEINELAEKVVDKILNESMVSVLDIRGLSLLMHFTEHEILGSARVLDEAAVQASPCNCFTYKDRDYCFARHGAIGLLTGDQQNLCKAGKVYEVKPGMKERFEKFSQAAETVHAKIEAIPKGERMEPWLTNMSEELAKKGIQV